MDIKDLEEFVFKNRFNTRGLPFAKKMWRDGYNKALDDFINHIKMKIEQPTSTPITADVFPSS